jgi:hypothetical protein
MTLQIRRGHRGVTTSSPLFTRIYLDAGQWRRAPTALSVAGDPEPGIMKNRILEMIGATEPERAFGVAEALAANDRGKYYFSLPRTGRFMPAGFRSWPSGRHGNSR